jgi:hypothetical protein
MRSGLRHALERVHQEEGAARAAEQGTATAAEAPASKRTRKKAAKARKSPRR